MTYPRVGREQCPLFCIRFRLPAQGLNGVYELVDVIEPPMDRCVTEIRDLIDRAQSLQNLGADRRRLNFAAAGLEIVHDLIDQLFQGQQTGGTFFESFGNAACEFAPVERLMGSVAFDHAQVRALDFLVSGKSISAFEAFTAAANARAIARLS